MSIVNEVAGKRACQLIKDTIAARFGEVPAANCLDHNVSSLRTLSHLPIDTSSSDGTRSIG